MGSPSKAMESFEPAIAAFFCEKCGDDCLSRTGETHGDYPRGIKSVRLICAEKVGPDMIRQAFEYGADGVLICGCPIGECESLEGNAAVLAHIHRSNMVMKEMGLAQGRLRQEWVCRPGGDEVPKIVADFRKHLRELGPGDAPNTGVID